MQFSAVLNMFIVKTYLNSTFTNDLKRKDFFSKNVQSYRVCSFKENEIKSAKRTPLTITFEKSWIRPCKEKTIDVAKPRQECH